MSERSNTSGTDRIADDVHRAPDELEREARQSRESLGRTIQALESKFSPGQWLDESMDMFRRHGVDFAANLRDSVVRNPLPTIVSVVGLGWLMLGQGGGTSSTGSGSSMRSRAGQARSAMADVRAGASERVAGAKARASSASGYARDRYEGARASVSSAATNAQGQAAEMRQQMSSLLEDKPIVVGALALALGAALGAAMPPTRREDESLGGARDESLDRAAGAAARAVDEARDDKSQEPRQRPGTVAPDVRG